jgi:RHS repeat-associated protein
MIDPNTGDVLFDQKGNTVYVTLTDHLGSVRDLVNTSGQVVNLIHYDAFGHRRSETNPQGGAVPFSPQMGFTGQFFDVATGLQYNHDRWYEPATGRWLTEDPIGFGATKGSEDPFSRLTIVAANVNLRFARRLRTPERQRQHFT